MDGPGHTDHPAAKLIGETLLSFSMPIERGKVREFARATGADVALYDAADAPIPPTFLVSSMLWEPAGVSLVERLGLDLTRVLQGGQEYRFPGELPRVGDHLDIDVTVESVTSKPGKRGSMTFLVLLTTYRRGGGIVAEGRATVIERSASGVSE
ncbi:FAS1-like dehydratase domain-containing protein [Sporichthya polymorpha]|uniref:FAS1-like dehydratase domain-containing protein n=1 Tax=Sporichthya polymorpha TaxID=35751 RepID=UPI00037D8983|nr:MaoC family dehydratase N-terminal domain-containing protein [Sporichthya polymorpha]